MNLGSRPEKASWTTCRRGVGTERARLIGGPGILLVWLYGVMVVGAVSRSAVQISTQFDKAPLAYSLSAVAGLVYGFITYSLVRGGETARRAALVCCAAELAGVLVVGTWTLAEPSAFPEGDPVGPPERPPFPGSDPRTFSRRSGTERA